MDFNRELSILCFLSFSLLFSGCAPKKKKISEAVVVTEQTYCYPTNVVFSNPVVITGTAQFQAYRSTVNGLSNLSTNPIRYAEVKLLDSSGAVSQCTETNSLGVYTFQIEKPAAATTYNIQINSRADGNFVKASILKDFESKLFYTITGSFGVSQSSVGTVSVGPITAGITGDIEGGAFNILDQILKTNEFLKSNTTTASCSLCQGFTVAPKVTVYWKKGFTPAAYSGYPDSGLSFFDKDAALDPTPSLYILGGINGDVNYSDTDHFDNSVIIHEYGHFLESKYSKSDSPGGSHNGNMIIDPRLALSEGFANFLPSAVTGSTFYIDTVGNPSGTTRANIYINLEIQDGNDSIVTKSQLGEGIFREVSVSRALYDYIDGNVDSVDNPSGGTVGENSNLSFAYIWAAFTHPDYGIENARIHFRSMGHLNAALKNILTTLNLTTELSKFDVARKGEFQTDDTSKYGLELKTISASSCTMTISPVVSTTGMNSQEIPNLFLSSDFYVYYHSGGDLNLSLTYTPLNGNPPDLDLFLYKDGFVIDDPNSVVAHSDKFRNAETPLNSETISEVGLAAGYYMIMVQAYTTTSYSGGPATYDLKTGGNYLCP
jgi:hypothetical protein